MPWRIRPIIRVGKVAIRMRPVPISWITPTRSIVCLRESMKVPAGEAGGDGAA